MFVVVVLVGVLSLCNAYPNGAPKEACVTMTPGHKYANLTSVHPQTTSSPYQVMVASNQYSPGATLKEPAPVPVGENVQGDLPQGTLQFLSFKVKIRRGMTFKLKMRVGSVNFYLSIRIRNPNRALYDFRLRTRPNKMRLDIFIPPSRLREMLGRERRQAVVDDDEEVELYASLEGVDASNQFDLETDEGDTADPAYLDNGSPRAAAGVLTLVMLLLTAVMQ